MSDVLGGYRIEIIRCSRSKRSSASAGWEALGDEPDNEHFRVRRSRRANSLLSSYPPCSSYPNPFPIPNISWLPMLLTEILTGILLPHQSLQRSTTPTPQLSRPSSTMVIRNQPTLYPARALLCQQAQTVSLMSPASIVCQKSPSLKLPVQPSDDRLLLPHLHPHHGLKTDLN